MNDLLQLLVKGSVEPYPLLDELHHENEELMIERLKFRDMVREVILRA